VLKEGYLLAEILCAQPSVTETQMVAGIGNPFGFQERLKKDGSVPLPGHEYCARVVKTNENSRFKPGNRVVGIAKIPCGACIMCQSGRPMLCKDFDVMGATVPGCFSELALLPERALIKIDDQVSDSEGACLQPLSDCVGAVDTAEINMGGTIAIFGQGCLGINALQVARASGAGMLIAVDVRDDILNKSKEVGAHYTINSKDTDPVEAIKEVTDGKGADIVFEAAGGNPKKGLAGTQTIQQSIDSVRNEGKIVILSIYGQSAEMPIDIIRMRGVQIISPKMTTTAHLQHASRLVASGQIQLKPIITQVLLGIDTVPKAFEITGNKGKYNSIMPAQVMMTQ
jgi:threonine dehydrogenase-like Zn-dependent dehydrogenase